MDQFYSLMFVMDFHSSVLQEESSQVDIVGRLPPEIATRILRLLPDASLAAAAAVSRRWLALCRADPELRRRVRRQLFREGRGALLALQEALRPPLRAAAAPFAPFARVNARARQLQPTVDPAPALRLIDQHLAEPRRNERNASRQRERFRQNNHNGPITYNGNNHSGNNWNNASRQAFDVQGIAAPSRGQLPARPQPSECSAERPPVFARRLRETAEPQRPAKKRRVQASAAAKSRSLLRL